MPNVLQIKHSVATASPTALEFGELAFSEASDTLFIGKDDRSVEAIGGKGTFAPLASPALTGTPTAPTAAPTTNTTQLATTAFVGVAASAAVTGFAPLASPALTGTPTAPTAAEATNTTQLATTAFVQSVVSYVASGYLTPTSTIDGGTF